MKDQLVPKDFKENREQLVKLEREVIQVAEVLMV